MAEDSSRPIKPESGQRFNPDQGMPISEINSSSSQDTISGRLEKGSVRFLNASKLNTPVNIIIGNRIFVSNLEYGSATDYGVVEEGNQLVTVTSSANPRLIYYRRLLFFTGGHKVTMVIIDEMGDVEVEKIPDEICHPIVADAGCLRVANMSFDESFYDIRFFSGDIVFSNIGFPQTTVYKTAISGRYEFFVSRSYMEKDEPKMKIIAPTQTPKEDGLVKPLYWFTVDLRPGKQYTAFIIGNMWSKNSIRVLVLED